MTASLASLNRRADRLAALLEERQKKRDAYDVTKKFTQLPKVDQWPKFAERTYIRTHLRIVLMSVTS